MFEKGQFLQESTFDETTRQIRNVALGAGAVLTGVITEHRPLIVPLGVEAAGFLAIAAVAEKARGHFVRQPDLSLWQDRS